MWFMPKWYFEWYTTIGDCERYYDKRFLELLTQTTVSTSMQRLPVTFDTSMLLNCANDPCLANMPDTINLTIWWNHLVLRLSCLEIFFGSCPMVAMVRPNGDVGIMVTKMTSFSTWNIVLYSYRILWQKQQPNKNHGKYGQSQKMHCQK